MTSSRILIKGGLVADPEPAGRADVLVEGGRIAGVRPGLPAPPGAEVIDASGHIVLPGFVDTHRHTWQTALRTTIIDTTLGGYLKRIFGEVGPRYRPEDIYAGTLAGALDCLDSGITTLVDWSHMLITPEHADAALEALGAAGIRAVFGHSFPVTRPVDAAEVRRLRDGASGLISVATAPLGPEIVDEDRALQEWRVARDLDLPVTVHMGGHGAESAERGLAFLRRHGLLGPRTTYIHANDYTDEALKEIAGSGGSISVSPIVEPALGIGYPITGRARAAGAPTGFSADTVTSAPGDMFSIMRAAYAMERGRPGGAGMGFTVSDALRAATAEGAEAAGLGGIAGALRPGMAADIVLLRADLLGVAPATGAAGAAVLAADRSAVDTVLVGGRPVKRDGALVDHDVRAVLGSLAESARRLAAG